LQEDVIWNQDFRPYFNLKANIPNMVAHGFTEMVNNAIDHSDEQLISRSQAKRLIARFERFKTELMKINKKLKATLMRALALALA
jgi:hypothetical protein